MRKGFLMTTVATLAACAPEGSTFGEMRAANQGYAIYYVADAEARQLGEACPNVSYRPELAEAARLRAEDGLRAVWKTEEAVAERVASIKRANVYGLVGTGIINGLTPTDSLCRDAAVRAADPERTFLSQAD